MYKLVNKLAVTEAKNVEFYFRLRFRSQLLIARFNIIQKYVIDP